LLEVPHLPVIAYPVGSAIRTGSASLASGEPTKPVSAS
jgi:hypothetical protein